MTNEDDRILREIINEVVYATVQKINEEAKAVEITSMPYKHQWILEEVIRELQERV
jgi:hypothetical protein